MNISPPPVNGPVLEQGPGQLSSVWKAWFSAAQQLLQNIRNYGVFSFSTLTSGFSVQFPQNTGILQIKGFGVLAAGTVTLPQYPDDQQQVTIASTVAITVLTVVAYAGQSVANSAGGMSAGSAISYGYDKASKTWFIIAAGGAGSGGSGGVTSVGLLLPTAVFTVSNTPVTSTGTLTGTFNTQNANTVFSGPSSGAAAVPTFRALAASDIASLLPSGANGYLLAQDGSTFITDSGLEIILD